MKRAATVLAAILGGVMAAKAAITVFYGSLVNETALAYNNTYSLDLTAKGIDSVAAQAVYSSATIPSASFGDGTTSSGTITVSTTTGLALATASDQITVISTSGAVGSQLTTQNAFLKEGVDYKAQSSTQATAASIAAALNHVAGLQASASGNVVYATATYAGTLGNSIQLVSSSPTAISVASSHFTGGGDNAVVTVLGQALRQGIEWSAAGSSVAVANSLASAINSNAFLGMLISATTTQAQINLVSKQVGILTQYSVNSTAPSSIVPSGSFLTGGTSPATVLGSPSIALPAHKLTLALPVLYSQGSAPVLSPLVNQTTYYAIPIDAGHVALASNQANALAGTALVIASSSTQATADTYTLSPLGISGTPGFKWQVSNDNSNWADMSVSSVTVSSYSNPPAVTQWNLGSIGFRFLRLNVTGPSTGGLLLQVIINGKD